MTEIGYNNSVFGDRLMVRPMGETSPERLRASRTFMYYVYILSSINFRKTYVGSTDDIIRRLSEHNSGRSKFTNRFKPWALIYSEELAGYSDARKRERYYKSGAGRKFIKTLLT